MENFYYDLKIAEKWFEDNGWKVDHERDNFGVTASKIVDEETCEEIYIAICNDHPTFTVCCDLQRIDEAKAIGLKLEKAIKVKIKRD